MINQKIRLSNIQQKKILNFLLKTSIPRIIDSKKND